MRQEESTEAAGEVKVDDLFALWEAGRVQLPRVASQYNAAAVALHSLHDYTSLFRTSEGDSPLAASWRGFLDTVQDEVVVACWRRLNSAGEVLVKIADLYSTTDHFNQGQLKELQLRQQQILGSTELGPPGTHPDPPKSTDPPMEPTPDKYGGALDPVPDEYGED